MKRVLTTISISVLIMAAPYWLYLPAIAVGIVLFPYYLEGVVLALVVDALYGDFGAKVFILDFPLAIAAAVLVSIAPLIHERLRIHA